MSAAEGPGGMGLRDYVRVVRRHWVVITAVTSVAVAVAAGLTLATRPTYASRVTFFVTASQSSGSDVAEAYQGGLFSQQRVKSYADLLTSERLGQAVVQDLGLDVPPDEVTEAVSAAPVPDTVLLRATVTDRSRDHAQLVAQSVARQFTRLIQTLETPPGGRAPTVKVEVVAGPRLDPDPVSPRPVRNLVLGTLLGLLAGTAVAVLRETLDTTVKSSDVLAEVSGAPLLATTAFDAAVRRTPVLLDRDGHAPLVESFRQLRTNLQFVDVDNPPKTVVVTSAVPNEGKSSTSANLAVTLAQAGSRVLLVEADLRRPHLTEYLGLEGAVGLTNVLVGEVEVDDVLQPWGRTGLSVLPSGSIPPNPSELLGSQNMAELTRSMRSEFDVVVIDTPPLLPVTDGAVTAALADVALLVVRYGKTTRAQVAGAVAALRAVDAHLVGCVFNMVPAKGAHAYGYSYGYRYGYRHEDRNGSRPRLGVAPEEAGPKFPRFDDTVVDLPPVMDRR